MSMFIRYIEEAKQTIVLAKHEADRFGSLEIGPEHILLALLNDPVPGPWRGFLRKRFLRRSTPTSLAANETLCRTTWS
jgi:hypothetical protein